MEPVECDVRLKFNGETIADGNLVPFALYLQRAPFSSQFRLSKRATCIIKLETSFCRGNGEMGHMVY
jgi:hypothetical protein